MATPDISHLSLEDKINHIFLTVTKIDKANSDHHERIVKLESQVGSVNTEVDSLTKEVKSLKNLVNTREQESRGCNIRINGFPMSEDELRLGPRSLGERVFQRILKPILSAAKVKGILSEKVPSFENAVSECWRIGGTNARAAVATTAALAAAAGVSAQARPPAPPIIVRLTSPQLRIAIMKAKRDATPPPLDAEKAAGFNRFLISEDLTPPAFNKLRELQSSEDVAKAWTVNGRIFFIKKDSNQISTCNSVFDDLQVILSRAR